MKLVPRLYIVSRRAAPRPPAEERPIAERAAGDISGGGHSRRSSARCVKTSNRFAVDIEHLPGCRGMKSSQRKRCILKAANCIAVCAIRDPPLS